MAPDASLQTSRRTCGIGDDADDTQGGGAPRRRTRGHRLERRPAGLRLSRGRRRGRRPRPRRWLDALYGGGRHPGSETTPWPSCYGARHGVSVDAIDNALVTVGAKAALFELMLIAGRRGRQRGAAVAVLGHLPGAGALRRRPADPGAGVGRRTASRSAPTPLIDAIDETTRHGVDQLAVQSHRRHHHHRRSCAASSSTAPAAVSSCSLMRPTSVSYYGGREHASAGVPGRGVSGARCWWSARFRRPTP